MKQSALRRVFFFRQGYIGLDNYKGKESLSRVVEQQMLQQDWDMMQEIIRLELMVIGLLMI